MIKDPETLVRDAVTNDQVLDLLLGNEPYRYYNSNRYCAEIGPHSLLTLLGRLYCIEDPTVASKLQRAMHDAIHMYEGILPVAMCVYNELFERSYGSGLGIPLERAVRELPAAIPPNESRLRSDFTYCLPGARDGDWGVLRRWSEVAARKYGCTPFFPESG